MRIDSPKMTNAEATGSFKGSFSGSFFGDIQADSVAFENITNVPNGIISGSASDARAQLGSVIGTDVQGYADNLNDIAGLNATDGSFIVGNGSAFVAESGAAVRTSLGLGTFAEISSLAYGDLTSIPAGIVSSSAQIDELFNVDGLISGSSLSSAAQGEVTLTTNGVAASAVDLGLQSSDSPTFAGLTVNGAITVTGNVDGRDLSADGTKLDGIETSADVTDATNVEAAGALMDSEVTDLAGIKGVTISTLQVKPSEGAFANGDKTKLDGIEAGAEVNVVTSVATKTGAVTLVKGDVGLGNVDNTSDLAKPISTATQTALDGKQDAGSFVTTTSAQALSSAANALTLVGNTLTLSRGDSTTDTIDLSAYLDEDSRSISSGTLNGGTGIVTFTRDDASTFTLDLSDLLDDTNLVTSVNGASGVVVLDADDIDDAATTHKFTTASDISKLAGIEASATADQTAAEIRTLVESATDSNVFTDDDHTKLNGIEAGATADQTAAEIRTLVESATDSNVFTDADHTKLNGIAESANNYTHPSHPGDDIDLDTGALTGATVISDLDFNVTTDTLGHVTDANATVATRTLTLADLGYTGATNANYITNNNQLTNGAGYTTYSANQALDNSSNVHFEGLMVGQTSGATANTIRCVGDIVAYYSSDAQFKDNVQQLEGALDKVKQIRGVSFDWNDKQDVYEGHDIGVIAQEVEAVYPELVHERDYNNSKAVDYVKLTAVLIEAVKELSAKVDELEKKCNC